MTPTEFALAAAALLLTPGPTNTLMAIGGTERGWRAAQPLMLFELAAYLLVTLPLALAGQIAIGAVPALKPAITLAAGMWVFWLAIKMWRLPAPGAAAQVTGRRIFVTTLLNPKALVFGLVLLPGPALAASALLPVQGLHRSPRARCRAPLPHPAADFPNRPPRRTRWRTIGQRLSDARAVRLLVSMHGGTAPPAHPTDTAHHIRSRRRQWP